MTYAAMGLGDSSVTCPLLPSVDSARSGKWADLYGKYGCPERIYPFWFFPAAPILSISPFATRWKFYYFPSEQEQRAIAAWRSKHPGDTLTPPFTEDTSSPDLQSASVAAPKKFWEGVPQTTIPCYCWKSEGFEACKVKVDDEVRRLCRYEPACIESNYMALRIIQGCGQYCDPKRAATDCDNGVAPPLPSPAALSPEAKADEAEAARQLAQRERGRKIMMYAAVGLVGVVLYKRSRRSKRA